MKRILALALCSFALNATAQKEPTRIDAARAAIDTTREYRGDTEFRDDRESQKANIRVGYQLDKLNRDVRQLRSELRAVRSSRIRERFDRLARDTDRLTAVYRQNRIRLSEAYQRTQDLRAELVRIRQMMRGS